MWAGLAHFHAWEAKGISICTSKRNCLPLIAKPSTPLNKPLDLYVFITGSSCIGLSSSDRDLRKQPCSAFTSLSVQPTPLTAQTPSHPVSISVSCRGQTQQGGEEGPGRRPSRAFGAHLCTLLLTTGTASSIVFPHVEHGTGPFGDARSQGLIHVSGLGCDLGYGAVSPWMNPCPTQEESSPHTWLV